jgi:23S rRNA pseudouridine1911/1915/1917 synthase
VEIRKTVDITVPPGKEKKERIDKFLARHIRNASRSKIQQLIAAQLVLVNDKPVKSSHLLTSSEQIHVIFPGTPRPEAVPENIPLDIIYEDKFLLVVNKPAGMVTHPAYSNYTGTLVNALLYYCNKLSTVNDVLRPGIVHRIDKDTSGLLVVAKDDETHRHLAKQFAAHTIEREYWAVVWGGNIGVMVVKKRTKKNIGVIEANLGRSKSDRKKMAVVAGGKSAVTEYEVIEQFEFLSLIKLRLKTGRTHQIRVHLSHIGHPVFGDPTYGGRRSVWGEMGAKRKTQIANLLKMMPRQALHAKTLGFVHPTTEQFVRFGSELPEDMKLLLEKLKNE